MVTVRKGRHNSLLRIPEGALFVIAGPYQMTVGSWDWLGYLL